MTFVIFCGPTLFSPLQRWAQLNTRVIPAMAFVLA
jgi:hypothetical protein